MASTSAAFGFRPVKYRDGKPYAGAANMYYVPSSDGTALYEGDPVILAGSADANGVPTVTRASAGGGAYTTGVVVGFVPLTTREQLSYRAASTAQYVLVADDPDLMFTIQEDAVGGSLAATNVAQNCDFVAGSGSTYTGLSGFMLDSSTANTTNTLQCRIEGLDNTEQDLGTTYQRILVSFNLHQRNNTTGI